MSSPRGDTLGLHPGHELGKTGTPHSKPPLKPKPVIPPHLKNLLANSESHNTPKSISPTEDSAPMSPPPEIPSAVKLTQLTGPLPYGARRPSLKRWTSIGEKEPSQESPVSPLESPITSVTSKNVTNKIPTLPKPQFTGTGWKGKSPFFLTSRGWGENWKQSKDVPDSPPSDPSSKQNRNSIDETSESADTVFLQKELVPVSSELKKEALLSETEVLQHERQLHQSPKGTFPVNDSPSKWDITESKAKTLESAKPSTVQEGNVIASTDIYETSVRVEKELPKDEVDLHQSPKESPESIFNMGLTAAGFDSPSTRTTLTTVEKPDKSQSLGKGLTAIENLQPVVTSENQGFTEIKAELSHTESGDEATDSYECAKVNLSEQPVSGSFPKYMSEYASLKKEEQDQIKPSVAPEESLKDCSLSSMQKHQTINKETPEQGLQFGDNAVEEHKQEKHVEWQRHDREYTDITQQSKNRFIEPMDGEEDVQALSVYTKEDYEAQHLPSAHVEIPNASFAGSDLLAPPEMFEQGHQQDVINIVSPTKETLQCEELRDLHPSTAAVCDYFKPSVTANISTNEAIAEVRDRKSDINKAEEIMDNENKVDEPDTRFKGLDLDHGPNYALFTLSGESVEAESSNDVIEQRMDTKTKSVHETYNEKSSAEFPSYMNEYKYRQPTNDSEYEAVDYTAILDEVEKSNHGAIPHIDEYTEKDTKNIEYNAEDVYFVNKDKDYIGHKYIESMCLNEKIQEDLPGQHDSNREIDETDDAGKYSLSYVDRYATQSYVMPSEDSKTLEFTQEKNVYDSHFTSKNLSSRSTPSPLADDNFGITPDAGENFTEELYNSNARFGQLEKPDDIDTKPDIPYMKYVEYETNVEEELYKEMPTVKFQQEDLHDFTHMKEPLDRSPESENSPYSSLKTKDIESKMSKQLAKNQNIYSSDDNTEAMDCGADENQLRYTELATNTDLHYDQQRPQVSFRDLEETYPDNVADVSHLEPHKFLESENMSQTETDESDLWYKNTQSELFPQSHIQLDQPQDTYMKLSILDYESVATQDKSAQSGEVKFLNVSEGQVGLPELDGSESRNTHYQESMHHNIQSHVVEHRNISPTFQPIDHQSQEDYDKKEGSQELRFIEYQPQEVEPRNETLQETVQNDSNSEVEQHIDNQLNKTPYLDHHDHHSQKKQYYESQEVQFNENLLQEEHPAETKPQDLQYAQEVHHLDNHDLKRDDTKLQEPQQNDDESDELEDHHLEEQSKEENQRDPEWSHQLHTESEELQQRETDLEDSKNETLPLETETESESEGPSPLDFTFLEGTEVLDTSFMRCRASLGKKRCHRAPPQLPCSNEEKVDPEYWMFRDSTESSPTKEPDSEEKECSPSTVSPVTSPGKSPTKKGRIFAGIMNPSLLKGRLKIRSKHADDEAAKKEQEGEKLSPKSSNPPEKDGHSLNWLSALKKKKKSK